jgi:hypothetical protein
MPKVNAVLMDTITKARFARSAGPTPHRTAPTAPFAPPGTSLRTPTPPVGARVPPGGHAAEDYGAMIEPVCRAICDAHDLWRMQAFFRGIVIHGPIATGGTLEGPALEPLLRTQLAAIVGRAASQPPLTAVAGSIGEAWGFFQRSVSVPGLPWYPSFAAVPGPHAPPTPNVPMPLAACTYDGATLSASRLVEGMKRRLPNTAPDVVRFFEAIAEGFQSAVGAWIPSQQVSNVLGQGPCPTFAPPYVPTSPVIAGDTIAAPTHLSP